MEGLRGKIIVGLTAVLVIAIVGSYQWWQKISVPITAELSDSGSRSLVSAQTGGKIMVYVSGAVNKPGVYEVESGLRVLDVINLAGGLTPGANTNKINMAQIVKDGHHVSVPIQAEGQATNVATLPGGGEKININTASKSELDKLPGIGPALAERIIEYRRVNGAFRDISDLQKVSGVGEAKFKQLASKITI